MDLSGIQQLALKNLKDRSVVEIPSAGCIIGRDGNLNPSYFTDFKYVSRHHAKIYYFRGKYFIQDLNSTNGTKVNGLKIENYMGTPIKGGDRISLADINFEVIYLW